MKNYRTPRTMAETTFDTGYPVKYPKPEIHASTWVVTALAIGALLIIWWSR
jgi:hypothetical protein